MDIYEMVAEINGRLSRIEGDMEWIKNFFRVGGITAVSIIGIIIASVVGV